MSDAAPDTEMNTNENSPAVAPPPTTSTNLQGDHVVPTTSSSSTAGGVSQSGAIVETTDVKKSGSNPIKVVAGKVGSAVGHVLHQNITVPEWVPNPIHWITGGGGSPKNKESTAAMEMEGKGEKLPEDSTVRKVLRDCLILSSAAYEGETRDEVVRFLGRQGHRFQNICVSEGRNGRFVIALVDEDPLGPGLRREKYVFVAVRGSVGADDWKTNFLSLPAISTAGQIHSGWYVRSQEIPLNYLKMMGAEGYQPIITGHSLGGAVAQIIAADCLNSSATLAREGSMLHETQCVTFAAPAPFTRPMAQDLNANYSTHFFNFVRAFDIVPRITTYIHQILHRGRVASQRSAIKGKDFTTILDWAGSVLLGVVTGDFTKLVAFPIDAIKKLGLASVSKALSVAEEVFQYVPVGHTIPVDKITNDARAFSTAQMVKFTDFDELQNLLSAETAPAHLLSSFPSQLSSRRASLLLPPQTISDEILVPGIDILEAPTFSKVAVTVTATLIQFRVQGENLLGVKSFSCLGVLKEKVQVLESDANSCFAKCPITNWNKKNETAFGQTMHFAIEAAWVHPEQKSFMSQNVVVTTDYAAPLDLAGVNDLIQKATHIILAGIDSNCQDEIEELCRTLGAIICTVPAEVALPLFVYQIPNVPKEKISDIAATWMGRQVLATLATTPSTPPESKKAIDEVLKSTPKADKRFFGELTMDQLFDGDASTTTAGASSSSGVSQPLLLKSSAASNGGVDLHIVKMLKHELFREVREAEEIMKDPNTAEGSFEKFRLAIKHLLQRVNAFTNLLSQFLGEPQSGVEDRVISGVLDEVYGGELVLQVKQTMSKLGMAVSILGVGAAAYAMFVSGGLLLPLASFIGGGAVFVGVAEAEARQAFKHFAQTRDEVVKRCGLRHCLAPDAPWSVTEARILQHCCGSNQAIGPFDSVDHFPLPRWQYQECKSDVERSGQRRLKLMLLVAHLRKQLKLCQPVLLMGPSSVGKSVLVDALRGTRDPKQLLGGHNAKNRTRMPKLYKIPLDDQGRFFLALDTIGLTDAVFRCEEGQEAAVSPEVFRKVYESLCEYNIFILPAAPTQQMDPITSALRRQTLGSSDYLPGGVPTLTCFTGVDENRDFSEVDVEGNELEMIRLGTPFGLRTRDESEVAPRAFACFLREPKKNFQPLVRVLKSEAEETEKVILPNSAVAGTDNNDSRSSSDDEEQEGGNKSKFPAYFRHGKYQVWCHEDVVSWIRGFKQ